MLVLLSMRDAGRQAFARGSGNMHLLVTADSSPLVSVLNGVFYANAPARWIPWSRYRQMAADPRLEWAIPNQQGDSFMGYPVLATTPDFFGKFEPAPGTHWRFARGRAFTGAFEVVLGSRIADASGLKLGDKIVLTHGRSDARGPSGEPPDVHREYPFEVVGILGPTGSSHDRALFISLESAWVLHADDRRERQGAAPGSTTLADITDDDRRITGVFIRGVTREGSSASVIVPVIASEFRRDPSLTVAEPAKEIGRLFGIVSSIDQILLAMAGVVMISSGIAIMLALYNSMEQRRRQIAILRVLGCSRPRIFGLIITESALLGLLGAAAGIVIAAVGGFLVAFVLRQKLGLVVDPMLGPTWVVGVAAATVLLAAAAGLVPAVMAYRTGVAKNLRPLG
jgi:putative ABC transport system permease protein